MKKIAPAALVALSEALANIYWYRREFRSFMTQAIKDPAILSCLNWDDIKRNVARHAVDLMAKDEGRYQPVLLDMMKDVAAMEDFSHLERVEDGKKKAKDARDAVAALRKMMKPHEDEVREKEKAKERRQASDQVVRQAQGLHEKLRELNAEFLKMLTAADHNKRGFHFEKVLKELFSLFDLDPKASFRIVGEQIDGAFTFDNTDYLLSAKWQKELVGIEDLDAFAGKIARKLENTLGLFVSVNGFSQTGIEAHCKSRPAMMLMDGSDLMAVLEGRIRLDDFLLRKRRTAAQTGNIFLRISDILAGT